MRGQRKMDVACAQAEQGALRNVARLPELANADANVRQFETIQALSCAVGVEREIFSSSSFMSTGMLANSGVLR
jgi:hypothetical protein